MSIQSLDNMNPVLTYLLQATYSENSNVDGAWLKQYSAFLASSRP
jgi:hypothetical protein